MPGKHTLKRKRSERADYRRTVQVVDAHTFTAHFLTPDALADSRHAAGCYIALCGQDVLPACLVELGRSRCPACLSRQAAKFNPCSMVKGIMTWYVRSRSNQDTHRGHLRRGRVLAMCGVEFSPLRGTFARTALPGEPSDVQQICPECFGQARTP